MASMSEDMLSSGLKQDDFKYNYTLKLYTFIFYSLQSFASLRIMPISPALIAPCIPGTEILDIPVDYYRALMLGWRLT